MAIKISGNTIIDDSRNLTANTITATTFTGNAVSITSIPDFLQVLAPTNISPSDGATEVSATPTLQVSGFQSTAGSTHANTQFQVSTASDFSSTVADVFTGANTTLSISSQFAFETEHFFRARYFDNNGCCSSFSTPTSFTTEPASAEFEGASFGDSAGGGFYMGTICAAGSCYYMVMAPNSTGCAGAFQYRTNTCCSGVGNDGVDGYGNTYDHLANATHPAGNWTATRSIGGFSDWYLPARSELFQLYNNKGCAPAGEGFSSACYWSSTERGSFADDIRFCDGSLIKRFKNCFASVRAVRRVPF